MQISKSHWLGNNWPSVEIHPYEYEDFLKVVMILSQHFHFPMPSITQTLDGYIADFHIDSQPVMVHMDNWTFSLATPSDKVQDGVYEVLSQHFNP